MAIDTNVRPRVMVGPEGEKPVAPNEDGLVYCSPQFISVWNRAAGAWIVAGGGGGGVPNLYFDSVADFRAFPYNGGLDEHTAWLGGFYQAGDGGGGLWVFDTKSNETDNSGTVIQPANVVGSGRWVRLFSGASSVKWFGATGDGVSDDTTSIQNALDFVQANNGGGSVFFPEGRYVITDSIVIGGAGNPVEGVTLIGDSVHKSSTKTTLVWGGAADNPSVPGTPMILIRNAHTGILQSISFEPAGLAAYCLQMTHLSGTDVNVTQSWAVKQCFFSDAARYNFLIGDAQGTYSKGSAYGEGGARPPACEADVSALLIEGCLFLRSQTGVTTTRSHVKMRAGQAFGVHFLNCTLDGDGVTPSWGIEMEAGGTVATSGVAQLGGASGLSADFYVNPLETNVAPNGDLVPPSLVVNGWESQSPVFMASGPTAATGGTSQRPTVLSGVFHGSESLDVGVYSVNWQLQGWGMLNILGGHLNQDVIINPLSTVYVMGLVFDDVATPGGGGRSANFVVSGVPTDHPTQVVGAWNHATTQRSRFTP